MPTGRRWAEKHAKPYVALEDGFLRSVGLGEAGATSLSVVVDDLGIYYDATRPSRLEQQIQSLKARRGSFDRCLFDNMVGKKKRLLEEAAQVDETLRGLLQRNT